MPAVLVLFAHPALERSRVHRQLLAHLPDDPRITLHDLYEAYPDFDIEVRHEQHLLTRTTSSSFSIRSSGTARRRSSSSGRT
jgi:glutathione-regulated potassium-efflux system ancillary protein KefG